MNKQVAVSEHENGALVAADANSIMAVISRAAADPNTDVEKLERLMALYERIEARNAKAAYYREMAVMKPKLPIINRRGRIEVREKDSSGKRTGDLVQSTGYALWEDIDAAITPTLAEHGFALTFRPGVAQDGKITVTGILTHTQGHSEEATITLPHDSSGSKNAVQAVGSSTSYGKRYAATMLLNIRTKGEDDDGAMAMGDDTITDAQLEKITDLAVRVDANIPKFCEFMKVKSVPEIRRKDYERAITALNMKMGQKK